MLQAIFRASPLRLAGAVLAVALFLVAASLNLSPAAAQQPGAPACEVTGSWSSSWGDMELTQSGSSVTGTYTWDAGTLEGSLSGSVLTGKWREAPSYSEPNDAGDIVFTFAADCASMTGKWRYGSSGSWAEDWTGTKLQSESGVIERDGKLYLISPPDGPLSIDRADLPAWARDQIVTVGAIIPNVGAPDHVTEGDPRVLIGGRAIARLGDRTAHGGHIVEGSATIFVNGVPAAFPGAYAVCPMITALVPHVGGPISADCNLDDTVGDSAALQNCLAEYGVAIRFLEQAAAKGDTVLNVDSDGFEIGDAVLISSDPAHTETAFVVDKGSLVLDRPLTQSFPAGSVVVRIPDEHVDQVPPPPSLAGPPTGSFSPDLVPGVNLTTYSGGTVAQLTSDAANLGATSIAVTSQGSMIVLVVGAPTFVNVAFEAHFTSGVPPAAIMIVLVS